MSRLKELIEELCPDGVEYKYIRDCTLKVNNIRWKEHPKEVYQYIDLTSVDRETHDIYGTEEITSENAPSRAQQIVLEGDVLLGATRPMLKRYCLINEKYDGGICSTGFCVLRPNEKLILSGWMYHIISSTEFFAYVENHQKGSSYPVITDADVKSFRIPVPPLDIQREIVRILDAFTEYTAELTEKLTAELIARKQQYEYYRNQALSFDDNTILYSLGEICNISSGGTPSKKHSEYWTDGNIKWLGSTVCQNQKTVNEITGYITEDGLNGSSTKILMPQTTLIALVGATIGKVAFLPYEATTNQNIAALYPKDTQWLNPSYLFYACMELYSEFQGLTQGTKLAMANLSFVRSLKIPVPAIEVQTKIAYELDCFEGIINDFSSGLPAEIEARQKQYEYYRDKLLTFKEKIA